MRPEHFQSILGTSFVRTGSQTVLKLARGKSYDRYELAAIGVPQIKAARYLHLICQRLAIGTPAELAANLGRVAGVKGIGHAAFYAALAIVADAGSEARALATYADVAVSKVHRRPGNAEWEPHPVTLSTLKRRPKAKPQTCAGRSSSGTGLRGRERAYART